MKKRTILAAGVLALTLPFGAAHTASAANGLGDCLERGTLTDYSAECPAIVHDAPTPRIGTFMGLGDPGDDIAQLIAACGGELVWYDQDDSFWCEPQVSIGTALVVERTIVTAEIGPATPIITNPKFMG